MLTNLAEIGVIMRFLERLLLWVVLAFFPTFKRIDTHLPTEILRNCSDRYQIHSDAFE